MQARPAKASRLADGTRHPTHTANERPSSPERKKQAGGMVKCTEKAAVLVKGLGAEDEEGLYEAVRRVKNAVIGSSTRKSQLVQLGAVPRLVDILRTNDKPVFLVQAAVALGSIAYGGEDAVITLVEAGAVPELIRVLHHDDESVVEAGVRSLKIIYQSPIPSRSHIFHNQTIRLLLRLTSMRQGNISECAAAVIARCCQTPEQQAQVDAAGGLEDLVAMLDSPRPKAQEAALDALASLTRDNSSLADRLLSSSPGLEGRLLQLLRDDRTSAQLLAAKCLANMDRVGATHTDRATPLALSVLPVVVKLCTDMDSDMRAQAPLVLAHLVGGNELLQKAASDMGVVSRLVAGLDDVTGTDPTHVRARQAAYLGLAALCSLQESSRKAVITRMAHVQIMLDAASSDTQLRIPAARCLRSLSKGGHTVRQALVDAGAMGVLDTLLGDRSHVAQVEACTALGNLALTSRPVKMAVGTGSTTQHLTKMARAGDVAVRLAVAQALKNITYMMGDGKSTFMSKLGWEVISWLLNDSDPVVVLELLKVLRNLTFVSGPAAAEGIDEVLSHLDGLVSVLAAKASDTAHSEWKEAALLIVSNIASGSKHHKTAILTCEPLMATIAATLGDKLVSVSDAALWCAVNLAWDGENGAPGVIQRFRALELDTRLREMAASPSICADMKDRAQSALQKLAVHI